MESLINILKINVVLMSKFQLFIFFLNAFELWYKTITVISCFYDIMDSQINIYL